MKPVLFYDKDQVERIRLLEDNAADVVQGHHYERVLTDDEISDEQEQFSAYHIELQRLENEKAEKVAELNAAIKIKRELATKSLQKIKTRREDVAETVYVIHDEDDQKVGLYNFRGELISERPMRAGERQHRLRFSNEQVEVSVTDGIGGKKLKVI